MPVTLCGMGCNLGSGYYACAPMWYGLQLEVLITMLVTLCGMGCNLGSDYYASNPVWYGLQLEGYKYASDDQKKDLRMRFFHTQQNIYPNHVFQPIVSAPTLEDRKPRVDWTEFHTVLPVKSHDRNHSGRLEELSNLWRTSSECACCACCVCAVHGLPAVLTLSMML